MSLSTMFMTAIDPDSVQWIREAPLATLIHPLDRGEFVADYWESRVLHTRGDRDRYAGMLTLARAEALLHGGQGPRLLRLVRDGVNVSPEAYRRTRQLSRDRELRDTLDLGRTWQHFAAGSSIIIQHVELCDEPAASLRDALEAEIQHRVEVHAFLAPSANQRCGLPMHSDPISAFILQLEGRRRWRIFERRRVPLPHERGQIPEPGRCLLDVELEPGDGLYIPRGHVHEVSSVGVVSLHLTVGVRVTTIHDVLEQVLRQRFEELVALPETRAALPFGWVRSPSSSPEITAALGQVRDLAERPVAVSTIEAAVDQLGVRLIRGGQVTGPTSLVQAQMLSQLLPRDTVLRRRRFLFAVQSDPVTDELILVLPCEDWRVPPRWRSGVEFVLRSNDPFRVDELPTHQSDDPRELAQELVASGLVELSAPMTGAP
ncbi:MAG: cupin domain-containing protein [Acidimicrobiia bacterium]